VAHASADRRRAAGGAIDSRRCRDPASRSEPSHRRASDGIRLYGDYGEIVITGDGHMIGVWGEGTSYHGPGGVWFDRQT
jgi:hypothetical protein